jgi:hypothetical protein
MKYQLTYDQFINEAINYDRIKELKDKLTILSKRLSIEADPEKKKLVEKQIKVNKLRLTIAQIG